MLRDFRAEMDRMLELHGGFYTYEDILEHILDGRMQSFAAGNTWVITQVNEFPRKKVLEIVFVIGDPDTLVEIAEQIEEFRKSVQADMMMATGRLGWLKRSFEGWKPVSINFVKV